MSLCKNHFLRNIYRLVNWRERKLKTFKHVKNIKKDDSNARQGNQTVVKLFSDVIGSKSHIVEIIRRLGMILHRIRVTEVTIK